MFAEKSTPVSKKLYLGVFILICSYDIQASCWRTLAECWHVPRPG